jgi:hypothetical protein
MTLKEIVTELDAALLYAPADWEEQDVASVIASDLISDILVGEGEDQLLLTSLTSNQIVRTADLIGAVAIMLVHRRQVPPALEVAAREQDIPLFRSAIAKYDACVRIGRLEETQ